MPKFSKGETVKYLVDGNHYTIGEILLSSDEKTTPNLYDLKGTNLWARENDLTKNLKQGSYED